MRTIYLLVLVSSSLAAAVIHSDDGTCDVNRPCPSGTCCSKWGYCGASPLHCVKGGGGAHFGVSAPPTVPTAYPTASTSTASLAPAALGHSDADTYKLFTGDGSLSQGWPSEQQWVSDFDALWRSYEPILQGPCPGGSGPSNSDVENKDLKSAIEEVARESAVDERFIFAIMMQESKGCVRVATTANANRNPGLMQSHNGTGDCTNRVPCSAHDIKLMLLDGVRGTQWGNGLEQLLATVGQDDSKYYKAAKKYNSGDNIDLKDMAIPAATHCYVSDIANRLTGWNGDGSPCQINGWL